MLRALVIDDNRYTADGLCQLLSLLDVNAQPEYGPRAAMELLEEEVPDIVFLDINMPGVNGFEVMAYLRREPRLSKIPIIVVTSDDTLDTEIRAIRAGAVALIVKPAMLESLESVLQQAKLMV